MPTDVAQRKTHVEFHLRTYVRTYVHVGNYVRTYVLTYVHVGNYVRTYVSGFVSHAVLSRCTYVKEAEYTYVRRYVLRMYVREVLPKDGCLSV